MTCMAFYKSVYETGCIGTGETCERCVPLITHPYLLFGSIITIALFLIIIGILIRNAEKEANKNKENK